MRLRRAERASPDDRDIPAVRAQLEQQLGPVSRSFAASMLGVSHTAPNRWIASGDVGVVFSESGRPAVSVSTLAELAERVEREREIGRNHVLEPAMAEGRDRAARLDPRELVDIGDDEDRHRVSELRGLAYHRALARRLRRTDVDKARRRLWAWQQNATIDPRYAARWEDVLALPVREIERIIAADDQNGRDLRQNSPFAGGLSEVERQRILREIH